jgi:hypothetical protein
MSSCTLGVSCVSCMPISRLVVAVNSRCSNASVMPGVALAPWRFFCDVLTFCCSFRSWYSAAKKHLNSGHVFLAVGFMHHSLQALL